jgi:hypothetical protein
MKRVRTNQMKSREELSNPYSAFPLNQRLVASDAIDLVDNHTTEKNGHYVIIRPIDKSKRIKKKS